MIHYFPLEHLEQRYTAHLDKQIIAHLKKSEMQFKRYYPEMEGRERTPPKPGFFLNAAATCEFKARQLAMLAKSYSDNSIRSGDILFFSDLWFPGIEMVRYLDFFERKAVKIRGLLHAGSFTDTDFVRQLERWASHFETAVFDIVDKVYVGSNFSKREVCSKRLLNPNKVKVTGFPLDPNLKKYKKNKKKKNIVIFNGRDCDEKQPWLFDRLRKLFTGVKFIWTQKENFSKEDYYEVLSESKVVVSFALQENFGFGILEAAYLGCIPILPRRLVYPEFFPDKYLYDRFDECVDKVDLALTGQISPCKVSNFLSSVKEWFR